MLNRLMALVLAFIFVVAPASGTRSNEPQIRKGTVVSTTATRLVMKDTMGKEQSFTVDHTTKVTVNGQPGKLEDLQETMPIHVALDENGKVLTVSTVDKDKKPVLAAARDPETVPCVANA